MTNKIMVLDMQAQAAHDYGEERLNELYDMNNSELFILVDKDYRTALFESDKMEDIIQLFKEHGYELDEESDAFTEYGRYLYDLYANEDKFIELGNHIRISHEEFYDTLEEKILPQKGVVEELASSDNSDSFEEIMNIIKKDTLGHLYDIAVGCAERDLEKFNFNELNSQI